MRRFWARACAVGVAVLVAVAVAAPVRLADLPGAGEALPIGSRAPMADAEMEGVGGERHSIRSAAEEAGVLVVFTSTTCPWVDAWEKRLADVARLAAQRDVGVIAVNPNAGSRDDGDGQAQMRERADVKDYPFPYVLDENAQLADAFGAETTPSTFLFDGSLRLVYRGAIDDNPRNAAAVDTTYLRTAITAMTRGEEVQQKITDPVGCPIQRPE